MALHMLCAVLGASAGSSMTVHVVLSTLWVRSLHMQPVSLPAWVGSSTKGDQGRGTLRITGSGFSALSARTAKCGHARLQALAKKLHGILQTIVLQCWPRCRL